MGKGFFLIRGLGGERDDRFLHRRLESRRDEGASGKGWPKEGKEEKKWGRVSFSFGALDGSEMTDFYNADWKAAEMKLLPERVGRKMGKRRKKWGRVSFSFGALEGREMTDFYTALLRSTSYEGHTEIGKPQR